MFMPKKNRVAIYSYLFKEGVMTVEKDGSKPKHHILDLPNIHVLDALKSLASRGFVRVTFNWQWFYYYLTDEGVSYLRQYLHLTEETVPATYKRPAKPAGLPEREERRGPRGYGRGDKKESGAPGEFRPRFGGEGEGYRRREGGFGRGAAPAASE